jgi:hypothetical protein
MKKQYLHLSAYHCDICRGPVISGWLGIRESAISKETCIKQVGAICISCGHRQQSAAEPERSHHVMPMEWELAHEIDFRRQKTRVLVEAPNRAELH